MSPRKAAAISTAPTEAQITSKILLRLRKDCGGLWVKIHGGPFQVRGLPDIIGCYKGRFVGLEVKRPSRENTLTAAQGHALDLIAKAGGISGLVTSAEEAVALVLKGGAHHG